MAQRVKEYLQLRAQVQSLNLLEKGMAIRLSILALEIPWTREPGRLKSMWSQRADMTEWVTLSSHCSHDRIPSTISQLSQSQILILRKSHHRVLTTCPIGLSSSSPSTYLPPPLSSTTLVLAAAQQSTPGSFLSASAQGLLIPECFFNFYSLVSLTLFLQNTHRHTWHGIFQP